MSSGPVAALDLGSGTVKLSVFQAQGGRWAALALEEANTELRRGMGADLTLKAAPIVDTLEAVRAFRAQAEALGYLCLQADAADETALKTAGIERARTLATVLPDDSTNVFVTLSARSLNRSVQIIARGELPTSKLR